MDNEQTKDVSGLEKEIINLKSQLDSINKKKEEAFKNKEDLKKQLSELIKKVKGVTSHNQKEGVNVQQLKNQRDQHNNNVKTLIAEIKTMGGGKRSEVNTYDFMRLKKDLEALEFKVEHEALTPSEEKKTMKKIRDLKKQYDSQNEFMKGTDKSHEISKKIEEEKKLADQFHNQLVAAKGDTMDYKKLKIVSKEIIEMRSKQEAEFASFIRLKQEFKEVSDKLKQKLTAAGHRTAGFAEISKSPISRGFPKGDVSRGFPKGSEAGHKPANFSSASGNKTSERKFSENKKFSKGDVSRGFPKGSAADKKSSKFSENKREERPRYNPNRNQKHNTSLKPAIDEKKRQEQMKIIEVKIKEVEEKLRSGQKLTTEDLLILQQKAD